MFEVDEARAAYVVQNVLLSTITHELGHFLGLNHIPVSGNAMSYRHIFGASDQWTGPMSLWALVQAQILGKEASSGPLAIPFVFPLGMPTYMVVQSEEVMASMDLFSNALRLGAQDRMALTCIYDF